MADEQKAAQLNIERIFTNNGLDPLDAVKWTMRDVKIVGKGGDVHLNMNEVEAPSNWSDQAVTIAASKYLKGAKAINNGIGETSIRAMIERVVDTIAAEGLKQNHFPNEDVAKSFRDELTYMLVMQMASFNSPVWFNCGLHEKYGMTGDDSKNFVWDEKEKRPKSTGDYFSHPQLSACFIQSIKDDLNDIWEHVGREGRIFKGGSGTGSNFSSLRSNKERLSSGGTSSGVISFLEVFDKVAGSTKSGGTNRRAAKMAILNADHPEIKDFIDWKMEEERLANILIAAGVSSGMDGKAYRTVSGQNSNNSVRLTDEFMQAVISGKDWDLKEVVSGKVVETVNAAELFKQMCIAAWHCADPGLQFDTTTNEWHTCPRSGRINASNPCSEFIFLDDSSCNLASMNLVSFINGTRFNIEAFKHACRLLIIAQDIIVDYASYPTMMICKNSHEFRPLGLGYTNLGSLLMIMGMPYDSDKARAVSSAITSIMTATAYLTSSELASLIGPFDGWNKNKAAMQKVINKHKRKAAAIDERMCPDYLLDSSSEAWEEVAAAGKSSGYRNAQVTLLAPTGTISFVMDADTTGIEPAYALVAFKTYAGGGYSKLVNGAIIPALDTLGYSKEQIDDICKHIIGHGVLPQNGSQSGVTVSRLKQMGFTDDVIGKINSILPSSPDLDAAISSVKDSIVLIESFLERSGHNDGSKNEPPLRLIGFTDDEIREVNEYCCGHMTIKGAPHIKAQHLAVFECASSIDGKQAGVIKPSGHVDMMAAVQPFLSGAISKTVNLNADATVEDIGEIYMDAWHKGLKCIAIYRDGCKGGQPLSAKHKTEKQEDDGLSTKPLRHEPPTFIKNTGSRRKIQLDRYTLYVHIYRDPKTNKVIEIFVNVSPGGGALAGMMDFSMRLLSMLLQYGVPIEDIIRKFAYLPFEPAGMTTHPRIQTCRSIIDLILRTVAVDILGDDSYANSISIPDGDAMIGIEAAMDAIDAMASEKMSSKSVEIDVQLVNSDDECPSCGSRDLKKTGTCKACIHCGTSLGCS